MHGDLYWVGYLTNSSLDAYTGLSRDPIFVQDFMADKLNSKDKMTARMGLLTLQAMKTLGSDNRVKSKDSVFGRLPLLLVQGTADAVTSVSVARAFYQRYGSEDKEMKEYKGFYHCLFNEPEKDQVLEDVSTWLVARAQQYTTAE